MKVGINARTFAVKEPDGAVQTGRNITSELCNRKDVEVVLYGSKILKQEFNADYVHSFGFHSNSPFFGVIWERTLLPLLVDPEEIDVLLCPNGNAPMTSIGCPIVTHIHDVNAQKGMSSGIHRLYRKATIPLSIRNSKKIITVSSYSKSEILEYLTVDEDSVCVIYNGVDDFYLEEKNSEILDLPEEYLLYVGAMNPRKNIKSLIEAYKRIHTDIPHDLVLIGPQNKPIYQKMDVDSFADNIITPGFIPKTQLKYAYENADGFIYPSLYEGFGLPPLEAMACGTRVVASNQASLPELLDEYCQLVDPFDIDSISEAMIDVATSEVNPERQEELKRHARWFTWERATEQLLKVLQNVTSAN